MQQPKSSLEISTDNDLSLLPIIGRDVLLRRRGPNSHRSNLLRRAGEGVKEKNSSKIDPDCPLPPLGCEDGGAAAGLVLTRLLVYTILP